ncbi:unnamed protein product [Prorocentrum cordatum]|uniref:Uncharacterized protein n=1 Tax=Prorocentrum cordatum TaxID=2364126 RepID=A0ABN9XTP4_9DINO|nr:unnamed protein product [Polarella glacialis]
MAPRGRFARPRAARGAARGAALVALAAAALGCGLSAAWLGRPGGGRPRRAAACLQARAGASPAPLKEELFLCDEFRAKQEEMWEMMDAEDREGGQGREAGGALAARGRELRGAAH